MGPFTSFYIKRRNKTNHKQWLKLLLFPRLRHSHQLDTFTLLHDKQQSHAHSRHLVSSSQLARNSSGDEPVNRKEDL